MKHQIQCTSCGATIGPWCKKCCDREGVPYAEAKEWDGEGLPPAGIRCEALRSHGWVEVYVVGYCEDGYCVFDTGSSFKGNKDPDKFRPIRSEEERCIDEMIAAAGLIPDIHRTICRDLYRAGFRKPAEA